MKQAATPYIKIIATLRALHKKHPTYNIGRHISTALDGYGDLWNVTDKEFLFALQKYNIEQEIECHPESQTELDRIINDGLHLDKLFLIDEEEYQEEDLF